MIKKIDPNTDRQESFFTPDLLNGEITEEFILPELDAAQERLNLLSGQLNEHLSNSLEGLCEKNCLKLSLILANMAEGVVVVNQEGNIETANRIAKQLLGLGLDSSFSDVQAVIESFGIHKFFNVKCQDFKTSGEFVVKTKAGKILQLKWNALMDGDRKKRGTIIVLRDTTAQVELDRAQTEFIAAISHELRTPLTTMQNYVSNMLAGITGKLNPKMSKYLTSMQQDCHRLTRLINDLLDMAKLEAGKMPIIRTVTNMSDIAAKAVDAFSSIAAQKGLILELNKVGCVCRAYVDTQRIYQVFSNLINNAIQFTDKGGRISVSIFESDNDIVSVVEDTGIGIPADRHHHIFNKFYQISRQAGAGYKGSGLGLSLSSEIVAVHGGKMRLESQPGLGSKFYFSLPKIKPEIILNKHLENLALRAGKKGERFALITVRLEDINAGENQKSIEAIMRNIMLTADEIASGNGDMIVHWKIAERQLY